MSVTACNFNITHITVHYNVQLWCIREISLTDYLFADVKFQRGIGMKQKLPVTHFWAVVFRANDDTLWIVLICTF